MIAENNHHRQPCLPRSHLQPRSIPSASSAGRPTSDGRLFHQPSADGDDADRITGTSLGGHARAWAWRILQGRSTASAQPPPPQQRPWPKYDGSKWGKWKSLGQNTEFWEQIIRRRCYACTLTRATASNHKWRITNDQWSWPKEEA